MAKTLIEEFRKNIHGELSNRSRVTDQILDVRQAAKDRPSVVSTADRLLADLPGLSIVANSWWSSALDDLELSLTRSDTEDPPSAVHLDAVAASRWSRTPLPQRRQRR